MKVFISHSSINAEIAIELKKLMVSIVRDINDEDIFCSSEGGSIGTGKDYIQFIVERLEECDAFIPLLSNDFYKSRFSISELGIACSFFFEKDHEHGLGYVYPFAVFPMKSKYALSGTPIPNLHVGSINSEADLNTFFTELSADRDVQLVPNIQNYISDFVNKVDRILLSSNDIISNAFSCEETGVYFDNGGYYKNRDDIVQYGTGEEGITINFNLDPEEKGDVQLTDFISFALVYVDHLHLGRYLEIEPSSEFCFTLNNFSNSLKAIEVEFKHGNNHSILKRFSRHLEPGMNELRIPLSDMKQFDALDDVSQICFVIHRDELVEHEGMIKLSDIKIRLGE